MKKKGFTLIEVIGVLVIVAIIALIATPLVMNIIRNSKESARKRSIDNYGKAIELAITSYLLDNGKFPTEVSQLNIKYSGSKVECGVEYINDDSTIYLEGCRVNDRVVENYTYGIDKRTAVEVLLSKTNSIDITNYNDGNKGEMYTFNHEATEQTPALIDYRYIGNVPNNYVSFNNGEVWRIIGVFDTDDGNSNYEKRIKLIRNDSLGNKQWNSSNANEWVGSTMQIYLNDTYEINDDSKKMIGIAKWYLGGLASYPNGEIFYRSERSETVSNVDRSTNWVGLMGLMYPSDYIYTYALGVDDICYSGPGNCGIASNSMASSGWMYRTSSNTWTITSGVSTESYGYEVAGDGRIYYYIQVNRSSVVFPTLYLKPEVKIKQGDGTIDNPYIFEL